MSASPLRRIPRTVWVLGFVSLLMDVSSEMIHAVLPLFMVQVLAADVFWVGLIEGAAEAVALAAKVFSGVIADRFGRHKVLVFSGYALGVLSKPVFAIADTVTTVFFARFADRIGKGVRGAPRDAIIADVSPKELLGASYGLRQSLDAAGAFVGPAIAAALLFTLTEDAFRTIFWLALIPGALCLMLILAGVENPKTPEVSGPRKPLPITREGLKRLTPAFRAVLVLGVLFSLARFSNAFIVLRAADAGIANAWIPLVMVGMNLVFSASSYPFGALADRVRPTTLLGVGLVLLVLSDVVFALWADVWGIGLGILLWGLHLGATQGVLSMLVAKTTDADWRATGFGLFNLASGMSLLVAGAAAGVLWDLAGPGASFGFGAVFALVALAWLATGVRSVKRLEEEG